MNIRVENRPEVSIVGPAAGQKVSAMNCIYLNGECITA